MAETFMQRIENANLRVEVNELGAELHSVFLKATGQELLYQADAPAWAHQDHILFPFIGMADRYTIGGKPYTCETRHGFCRVSLFSVVEKGPDYVTFLLHDNPQTRPCYPFAFELRATYRLEKDSLRRSYEIKCLDGQKMPFFLGDHAAYQARFGEATLQLGDSPLDYLPSVQGILQKEQPFPHSGTYLLTKEDFQKYETIVLFNPHHPISLCTGFGPKITYHFHSPYLAIWSPTAKADFLCVEPWWGLCAYKGQSLDFAKRKNINLCSGSAFLDEKVSYAKE
jgi:galactose mutarotase-like enzyme